MEAKNKAVELVEKFGDLAVDVVDEILSASPSLPILSDNGTYGSDIEESTKWWKKVKQEIINLKQQEWKIQK